MESVFPGVLFLGPALAPIILRIAAAVAFFVMAHTYWKHKEEFSKAKFPIATKGVGMLMTQGLTVLTVLLGIAFALGLFVQVAAILGFFGALKQWYFSKAHPHLFPFKGFGYFLLATICVALFVLGAGALAFDLPY